MKFIASIFLFLFSFVLKAQLVLNNGIIVNVNGGTSANPITIVLANPPATPITQSGTITSQGILLESEYNRLQYNLDQGTTGITLPYISNTTGSWVPFPLVLSSVTAGTRAVGKTGAIRFSSTRAGTLATGWDDYNYKPSQVLNMCGNPMGTCVNNSNVNDISDNVVDRFWIIEPVYYNSAAQRPAVTLDFTYIMQETNTNSGNIAALSNSLEPQRFDTINTGTPIWGWNGFPSTPAEVGTNTPGAMTATGVGTVIGVQVTAANFFPDWTLASKLIVLPVTLLNFTYACENTSRELKWTSATELNSDYYTIEKSGDGINFTELAKISSVGNSIQNTVYSFIDVEPTQNLRYYRLSETDKNGAKKLFNAIAAQNCLNDEIEKGDLFSYGNNLLVNLNSLSNQPITLTVYDLTGRLVLKNEFNAAVGPNLFKIPTQLAQGIYVFELLTNKISLTKKLLIEN